MIEIIDLSFKREERLIHDQLNFRFEEGKTHAIIGPNGAGKSTLLNMLSNQLHGYVGEIKVKNKLISNYSSKELAKIISFMPQNELQDSPFSLREFVHMGNFPHGKKFDINEIDEIIELVGLEGHEEKCITNLSGGEFRLASLGRVIAQNTPIVLLDELDQGLDITNKSKAIKLILNGLKEKGKTIISVIHDINIASMYFDKLILLSKRGYIVDAGTPEKVLTKENLDALFMSDIFVENSVISSKPIVVGEINKLTGTKLYNKKIHLVCGGGSGGRVMSNLVSNGAKITTGVLNIGDTDWKTASILGITCVLENPFSSIRSISRTHNKTLMTDADFILISGFPVGVGNIANIEDCLELSDTKENKIYIINVENFSDHTGGKATDIIERLKGKCKIINDIKDIIT